MHQKTGHLVPFHERIHIHICERPFLAASSTDRCNTFCELLSRRLIEQGLSRPFVELPCDGTWPGCARKDRCHAEDIGAAICWCFHWSRAARETEGHKNRHRPRWPMSGADGRQ